MTDLPAFGPDQRPARAGGWPTHEFVSISQLPIADVATGVSPGSYATGNGTESDERTRFLDFEYAPTWE